MNTDWAPLEISQIQSRFAETSVPWWIAGGRAIDLFLGWETRAHADVDIEMFRSDKDVLFEVFAGWELKLISGDEPIPFNRDEDLAPEVFAVWGRPSADDAWSIEVMLADGDPGEWRFRRDNSIRLSGGRMLRRTDDGVPYGTPEAQLLYKSLMARAKDDVDFARCLHRLTSAQREWLGDAIARSEPAHPWVRALRAANSGSMNEA